MLTLCALPALFLPTQNPVPPQGVPRNILVIVADDVGVDRVGVYRADLGITEDPCHGGGSEPLDVRTPTIDQLATSGILFRNAWSNPTCSPTRATLLTGRFALRTGVGVWINKNDQDAFTLDTTTHTTIAHALAPTYQVAARGKWHLAAPGQLSHPIDSGFDTFKGSMFNLGGMDSQCGEPPFNKTNYEHWRKTIAGAGPPFEECSTTYATTDTTLDAIQFIQDAGDDPWFLYAAYNASHSPFHVPPAEFITYDDDGIPLTSKASKMKAMTEALDYHIQRLLEAIPPDVKARTTIIFVGDNGTPEPARCYFPEDHNKGSVYEGGVRVPLIIVSPETPPAYQGWRCDSLVNVSDLYATIAELADVQVEPRDSVSAFPYLLDPTQPSLRDHLYTEKFDPNGPEPFDNWSRAVRGDEYKYVRKNADGATTSFIEEFYRVADDLREETDLYADGDLEEGEEHEEFIRLKMIMDTEIPIWDPAVHGEWLPGFQHYGEFTEDPSTSGTPQPAWVDSSTANESSFNAVHMSLIPTGFHRGRLLVWDVEYGNTVPPAVWQQRWAIVDVLNDLEKPRFLNYLLTLPANEGDLFCAGHGWTPVGNLFVAGGTTQYPGGMGLPFLGGKLSFVWQAPETADVSNVWVRQEDDLLWPRWYPTVFSLDEDRVLVLGGRNAPPLVDNDNTYEEYTVGPDGISSENAGQLFPGTLDQGPLVPDNQQFLHFYPRMTLLGTGSLFFSGFARFSQILTHDTVNPIWEETDENAHQRTYGTSVHLPDLPLFGGDDAVLVFGGKQPDPQGPGDPEVTTSVQYCFPTRTDNAWKDLPDLFNKRWRANAVVLPDARILVLGGDRRAYPNAPHIDRDPVFNGLMLTLREEGGEPTLDRQLLPGHTGERSYHSTTVLLPNAMVLIAGGDTRNTDYQLYKPSYLTNGTERPVIVSAPPTLSYGANAMIVHEVMGPERSVESAVLLHPGSVTHHTDHEQRYFALDIVSQGASYIDVSVPLNQSELPPGHYMLFLVSDEGTPSDAAWVKVD